MRVVIIAGCMNPGSHPKPDCSESLAAYSDLQTDRASSADVDWYPAEFDRIAEQTLGSAFAA